MDRNTLSGLLLIFLAVLLYSQFYLKPHMADQVAKAKIQDSVSRIPSQVLIPEPKGISSNPTNAIVDSSKIQTVSFQTISNALVDFKFSNLGGRLVQAKLNQYQKIISDSLDSDIKTELLLFEDEKNVFDYTLETTSGIIHTKDLYFEGQLVNPHQLDYKAILPDGSQFIQSYKINDDYTIDYSIRGSHIQSGKNIQLNIQNYLDKIEKNSSYERSYSTVYFKEKEKNSDYCSCRKDDKKEINKNRIHWFSFANQFFNSSLISETGFENGEFETIALPENSKDLKLLKSKIEIPIDEIAEKEYKMKWFIGPNEYKKLAAFNVNLTDIVPYGWSIFGTINRHLIRPLFLLLSSWIGSMGIVILLMTLVVKLLVFPLGYKMLHSQAKMMALKPEIEKVKNKNKDDLQKQQVETMKMYNEFGVNPLGGCLPMVLQMPIWIALYRFFPATIEFRQKSFLWATDLTSYDVFFHLPFTLPFFGNTISLFAVLWMISTLVFTYFSSKTMDFSSNPAMLYMQYFMPIMLWAMFNRTAAGLSCYMFFSNLLNITQTVLGRNYLFDQDKIRAELETNKTKPKKQGGFQSKMADMMKEQQRIQAEKAIKK